MIRQVGNSQTTSLGPFRKSEYSLTSFYSKTLFDCGGQLRRVAEELIDGRRFVREIGFYFYRSAPVRVSEWTKRRLFVQVESSPLEVGEPYCAYQAPISPISR